MSNNQQLSNYMQVDNRDKTFLLLTHFWAWKNKLWPHIVYVFNLVTTSKQQQKANQITRLYLKYSQWQQFWNFFLLVDRAHSDCFPRLQLLNLRLQDAGWLIFVVELALYQIFDVQLCHVIDNVSVKTLVRENKSHATKVDHVEISEEWFQWLQSDTSCTYMKWKLYLIALPLCVKLN